MRWRPLSARRLHRSAGFLRLYHWLPHGLLGRISRALTTATRPRWAIDLVVQRWISRAEIRMEDYQPGPFPSVEAFFLRRLQPGARPIGDGFVAPADGLVVGAGPIARGIILQIKGVPLALDRLTSGRGPALPLAAYEGGRYTTIFLTPHGYHRVHMPCAATVVELRWISGRAFPQNADALRHIPRIYERNERATLRCRTDDGHEFLLVMVGASLIGGIHLHGLERRAWVRSRPHAWGRRFERGEELGHFSFGSTIVLLVPPALVGAALPPPLGSAIHMGQRIY